MLLWLPLSGSNALAMSLSMQVQPGDTADVSMEDMHHHDMAGCGEDQPAADGKTFHNSCANCQLACHAWVVTSTAVLPLLHMPSQQYLPLSVSFDSFSTAPLLPPPLARA